MMPNRLHWPLLLLTLIPLALACSRSATSTEGQKGSADPPRPPATASQAAASPAPSAEPELPRLQGPHRAVFQLAHNRLLAHLVRDGGLVIPLGYPGTAKYLRFGRPWSTWAIDAREGSRRVAVAKRSVTWLEVPLTAKQAGAKVLALRVKSAKPQGLRVKLNGKALEKLELTPGWQTATASIPAGALRTGENRIELRWARRGPLAGHPRAFGAAEWLYIGNPPQQQPAANLAPDIDLLRDKALWLPPGGGLAYYVFAYRDTKLQLGFSSLPQPDSCALVTELDAGTGAVQRVERRGPAGRPNPSQTFVDLAPIAERVARLTVRAEGKDCAGVQLHQAALVLPGAAPQVKRGPPPKNVLFWLIDNARADRYRLYNSKSRVETPVIDQLGATGTVFERPYIAGTESRVSHASLWTGMFPKQHGFIGPKARLSQGFVTLAEAIGKAGLTTAAWTANGNVSQFWGFGQGWDRFLNTLHKGGGLSAKALGNHAIKFIRQRGAKPFFVYVGTIDPHVSWRARKPWIDRYYPKPYSGKYGKTVWGKDWDRLARRPTSVSAVDRRRIKAVYDSTISYNDQQLGRVLDTLKERGLRDQTMVVITADHGEELWEYDRIGHGGSLRETVVHVPLLVHYPPLFGSGVRVREGVDAHAILATILDALGAKIPTDVQAASLLPLAQGVGSGYPRPSFASQYELAHVMKLERYKMWVGGKGEPRVFDLGSKQLEHADIASKNPRATRWLTDALSTFLHYQPRWRQSRWGVASNHLPQMADDLEGGTGPAPIQAGR